MAIAMTTEQERDFEEKGFVILENFLTPEETERLSDAADEVVEEIQAEKGLPKETHFQVRNALSRHEAFLDLIDHPRMLPLVVDAIGWNIQIRTTISTTVRRILRTWKRGRLVLEMGRTRMRDTGT